MKALCWHGTNDVRVDNVPDAQLIEPTDALVRVTRACICGSDLWPYRSMEPSEAGERIGHEFIGVVEAVGSDVRTVKAGDLVVAPFAYSDGTCVFCHEGLQTSCIHGGFWARDIQTTLIQILAGLFDNTAGVLRTSHRLNLYQDLVAGGLFYTIGVLFFAWNKLPYNHAIWHIFVIAGSVCHFLAVLFYVLPSEA